MATRRHDEKNRKEFGPRGGPVGGPVEREKPGPIDGPLTTGVSGASSAPQEHMQQPVVAGGTV